MVELTTWLNSFSVMFGNQYVENPKTKETETRDRIRVKTYYSTLCTEIMNKSNETIKYITKIWATAFDGACTCMYM